MTTTFALPDYSFASAMSRALSKPSYSVAGTSYSGPSPFEVPEAVEITLERGDNLTFQFSYSDQEKSEGCDRPASTDGCVTVQLGAKTKKILQIRFRGDVEKRLQTNLAIDIALVVPTTEQLPKQSANSFRQNAIVIQSILTSIPAELVT